MNEKRENSRAPLNTASDEEVEEDPGSEDAGGSSHLNPGDTVHLRRGHSRNRFRSVLFNYSGSRAIARSTNPAPISSASADQNLSNVRPPGRDESSNFLKVPTVEQYSTCESGVGGEQAIKQRRVNGEETKGTDDEEEEEEVISSGSLSFTAAIRRCAERVFQCRKLLTSKGN